MEILHWLDILLFFQAEDGIRDIGVTGVQTCALPILAKAGASILLVPAAFTRTTGKAHWHVLLRARAIETGCFVVAASQCGEAANGRLARFGHSLVVGPWGEVLADAGEAPGVATASLEIGRAPCRERVEIS